MPPGLGHDAAPADASWSVAVASWSVDQVVAYANFLELPHLEQIIRFEGIDGRQLLTDSAMQDLRDVGITNLQAKKLIARLPMLASLSWQ